MLFHGHQAGGHLDLYMFTRLGGHPDLCIFFVVTGHCGHLDLAKFDLQVCFTYLDRGLMVLLVENNSLESEGTTWGVPGWSVRLLGRMEVVHEDFASLACCLELHLE